MERMHHGPYRAIAKRVARIASNTRQLAPKSGLVVAIDATGLGRPFAETVTEELRLAGVRCGVGNVVLTAGEKLTCSLGDAEIQLSKSVLVSSLTALFEARRIKLPRDHPEAEAMLQELLGFQIRVSPSGQDTYESRVGAHDDLVIASGMATIGQWRRPTVVRGLDDEARVTWHWPQWLPTRISRRPRRKRTARAAQWSALPLARHSDGDGQLLQPIT